MATNKAGVGQPRVPFRRNTTRKLVPIENLYHSLAVRRQRRRRRRHPQEQHELVQRARHVLQGREAERGRVQSKRHQKAKNGPSTGTARITGGRTVRSRPVPRQRQRLHPLTQQDFQPDPRTPRYGPFPPSAAQQAGDSRRPARGADPPLIVYQPLTTRPSTVRSLRRPVRGNVIQRNKMDPVHTETYSKYMPLPNAARQQT